MNPGGRQEIMSTIESGRGCAPCTDLCIAPPLSVHMPLVQPEGVSTQSIGQAFSVLLRDCRHTRIILPCDFTEYLAQSSIAGLGC